MDFRASVREIAHDSSHYEEVCRARDRILRQPLGMRLSDEDCRGEACQRHFVLVADGRLVGGVIARPEARRCVRLRQMWIETDHTGRGLGRLLLEEVARRLAVEGVERLTLHARQPVLGFYRKCGFREEGTGFLEVGIPHRKMRRQLSPGRQLPDCRR